MVKAVIFDMDGVLIDSQPIHYEADTKTLEQLGVSISHRDLEKYAGTSNPNRFARFKKDFGIKESIERITALQESIIFNLIAKKSLYPIKGIKELLEELKSYNLKIAVASSSSHRFIDTILVKINLKDYFSIIVSGEDSENSKPAPDIFLATANKLNVSPSDCIVIEDSMNGVLAALAAQMKCIGYINPTSGNQDLSKATIIIDDFAKLSVNHIITLY